MHFAIIRGCLDMDGNDFVSKYNGGLIEFIEGRGISHSCIDDVLLDFYSQLFQKAYSRLFGIRTSINDDDDDNKGKGLLVSL